MTRVFVFTSVGFLLLSLLGAVQRLVGLEIVVVDVPVMMVLYLAMAGRSKGQSRNVRSHLFAGGIDWTGGATSLLLGYCMDVLGGGLKGVHAFALSALFLLSLWAARHVYLGGTLSVMAVTFVATALAALLGLSLRLFGGISPNVFSLAMIASQAVLSALLAPLFMRLFRFLDGRLAGESAERGSLHP